MVSIKKRPSSGFKAIFNRVTTFSPCLGALISKLWFRRVFHFNNKYVCGKQNKFEKRDAVLNGVKLHIIGNNNSIIIESMAVLDSVIIHIHGSFNNITIGKDCRIGNSTIWVENNRCEVQIGALTTFGGVHLAATEDESRVIIGVDCMLAYDIDIRTGDSHGIYDQGGVRINKAEDVLIGDHVWIATDATILKGVTIGEGSIIGTGAVVTKGLYPAYCIVAGNPATVIRNGIQWTRLRTPKVI